MPAGYKQTEVGIIPDDWATIDLSRLCTLQRGFDITEATRAPGTIPVYSSSGLSYFHNKAMVNPPGVVTGRKGILGKVFLINEPFWPHDTTLWVKDFKGNHPAYVALVLQSFHLERLDAATSVPTLNRNNLAGHSIAIPPTKVEQEAIAEALSDADALIKSLEQLLAKKRQLKQGAMQELLTGQKRLPGFELKPGYKQTEAGVIPWDWDILPLSKACMLHNGRAYALHEWEKSGTPVIRLQNLTGGADYYYSTLKLPDEKYCDYGDLLFMWSATFGPRIWIGERAIYHYHIWKVTPCPGKATRRYLFYKLGAITEEKKTRAANGGTMLHVTKGDMEATLIALPKIIEQAAIAAILSDMDAEIAALEAKLAKARQLKQGMMQELLTGRIRLIN